MRRGFNMKNVLTKEEYNQAIMMIDYWSRRIKGIKTDISRYDFEKDMEGIHELFNKPPQNSQDFLRDYADVKIEFRNLFIHLYGDQQKEEDIIRRWANED